MIDRMRLRPEIRNDLEQDPIHSMAPEKRDDELFRRQVVAIKQGLKEDLAATPPQTPMYAGVRPHRTFMSPEDVHAVQHREMGGQSYRTDFDGIATDDEDGGEGSDSAGDSREALRE